MKLSVHEAGGPVLDISRDVEEIKIRNSSPQETYIIVQGSFHLNFFLVADTGEEPALQEPCEILW